MFSRYVAHVFSEWLEIVPVAPIITGITFVFTFHMRCIFIVRSLYFRIFSASFLITFLSPEIATSINIHFPFSLSRIIMSGLLLGIVLSVCTCLFYIIIICRIMREINRVADRQFSVKFCVWNFKIQREKLYRRKL